MAFMKNAVKFYPLSCLFVPDLWNQNDFGSSSGSTFSRLVSILLPLFLILVLAPVLNHFLYVSGSGSSLGP